MGSDVHCQCSRASTLSSAGKVKGKEYCYGKGKPLVHPHRHCKGPYEKDGYYFGDYLVSSVYSTEGGDQAHSQYEAVGGCSGCHASDEGNHLSTIKYSNLQDCETACDSDAQCKHFTACPGDGNKCYLKTGTSKVADLKHTGRDCQMYFPKAKKITNSFTHVGSGYCNSGYYDGWNAADAVNLETCKAKCLKEPKCMFISLLPGKTCSRYDSRAGHCPRAHGHSDHQTYARRRED